jgi:hypothetical protein
MTTTAANKELVRRLYGGLMAKGDTAVAEKVLAEDYLDHDISGVGQGGRQELVAAVLGVRAAVPDIAPTLDPILAEGRPCRRPGRGARQPHRRPIPTWHPRHWRVHHLEGSPHFPLRGRAHRRRRAIK